MPEFDFSGSFINLENCADNDILTISAMPMPEQKESAQAKEIVNGVLVPKKYMVLNVPVTLNGNNKNYTPDSQTGMRFVKSWGKDYSQWIGKQFTVKHESYKAFGADKKRVAGFPLVEEKK